MKTKKQSKPSRAVIIDKPLAFIDLETTGKESKTARIIEIAILKVGEGGEQLWYEQRVNSIFPIPKVSIEVHGITDADVKLCPTFKEIAKEVIDFIDGCDLAGYGCNHYDFPVLYNEFERAGIVWNYKTARFIDVANIFKRNQERTLSAAVRFYLNEEHTQAHGARADVEATSRIFAEQLNVHPEVPIDMNELALYCNYDQPRLDLAGKFSFDEAGNIIFNFGKNKDCIAKNDRSYLSWMLTGDFPEDTKEVVRQLLGMGLTLL